MKTIRPIGIFSTPTEMCKEWDKLSKGNCTWNNIKLVDTHDADYTLIVNLPVKRPPDFIFNPSKTILYHMEPSVLYKKWGYFADPPVGVFMSLQTHKYNHNNLEWHLGKTYHQLKTEDINKSKIMSTVTSSLYSWTGHKKRIDFLKYLDSKSFEIDIYGKTNDHDFSKYKGALPTFHKEDGLLPYKYTFASENFAEHNYVTEKLIDAILSECLCFYWGCPNLESYIDSRAFIRLDLDDHKGSLKKIEEAILGNEWEKRISVIRQMKHKILDELSFFPTLEKIINEHEAKSG